MKKTLLPIIGFLACVAIGIYISVQAIRFCADVFATPSSESWNEVYASQSPNAHRYHHDKHCVFLSRSKYDTDALDKEEAEENGLSPCGYCLEMNKKHQFDWLIPFACLIVFGIMYWLNRAARRWLFNYKYPILSETPPSHILNVGDKVEINGKECIYIGNDYNQGEKQYVFQECLDYHYLNTEEVMNKLQTVKNNYGVKWESTSKDKHIIEIKRPIDTLVVMMDLEDVANGDMRLSSFIFKYGFFFADDLIAPMLKDKDTILKYIDECRDKFSIDYIVDRYWNEKRRMYNNYKDISPNEL